MRTYKIAQHDSREERQSGRKAFLDLEHSPITEIGDRSGAIADNPNVGKAGKIKMKKPMDRQVMYKKALGILKKGYFGAGKDAAPKGEELTSGTPNGGWGNPSPVGEYEKLGSSEGSPLSPELAVASVHMLPPAPKPEPRSTQITQDAQSSNTKAKNTGDAFGLFKGTELYGFMKGAR